VLTRWFSSSDVQVPVAKSLDIILYSREQLVKEYGDMPVAKSDPESLPNVPWGIISVKAQVRYCLKWQDCIGFMIPSRFIERIPYLHHSCMPCRTKCSRPPCSPSPCYVTASAGRRAEAVCLLTEMRMRRALCIGTLMRQSLMAQNQMESRDHTSVLLF